jgi:uncharacterized membrane protein
MRGLKMKVNKHKINTGTIEKYIMVFVLVLVLFKIVASVFPQTADAATELNDSGFPLAEFFLADGVLWYLVAIGLLFLVYKSFTSGQK